MTSFRLLRLATLSAAGRLDPAFSAGEPGYDEMRRRIFASAAVYGDAFASALRALGHEAEELLVDCEPLQRAWAKEHAFAPNPAEWRVEIALRQIADWKPDVLFLQSAPILPAAVITGLKARFPFLRLVACHHGTAVFGEELRGLDLLFLCTPYLLERARAAAPALDCRLLYHAFNDAVRSRLTPSAAPEHDFTFLGSSGFGLGLDHQTRYWQLHELFARTPLAGWLLEPAARPTEERGLLNSCAADELKRLLAFSEPLRRQPAARRWLEAARNSLWERTMAERHGYRNVAWLGQRLPPLPLADLYPDRCRPPAFGLEMYRTLASSRLTFNSHTDAAGDTVGNMRLFEATGIGAALVTDQGSNLKDLFDPDHEVVAWRTIDECVEKVEYLLAHEEERKIIAAAGAARTRRDHTYARRAAEIEAALREKL